MQTSTIVKNNSRPTNRPIYWVLFFTLIGFGLRLYRLDFQPLWGDEGWSFYFATQPLGHLLALTAIDIHPPLYYVLLKIWLAVAGVEAEMARFLSVVIGTLLLPAVYLLGCRLFERRVGLLATGVAAVMPLAIYYSQEVRMYGLVTLWGALSVYSFIRWQQSTSNLAARRWQWLYILATTAGLYTHYYAVLILSFQVVYVLVKFFQGRYGRIFGKEAAQWPSPQPSPRGSLASPPKGGEAGGRTDPPTPRSYSLARLIPFIYISLLYLPWVLYVVPRLTSYVENKRNVEGYQPLNFIRFFGDHFVAFSVGHVPDALRQYIWAVLPFILVASLGFLATLYFHKNRSYPHLFLYLFVPLLLGYGINLVFPFNPPYFERTLLLAAPAYWLFIAVGLIWLWDRQYLLVGTVVLGMLIVVGVMLAHFYTALRYPHEDYRPLLKKIAAQATPEDTLLASYQWQLGFYQAYLPDPQPRLFSVPAWGAGWAGEAGRSRLEQDLTAIFADSPRLWFPAYQASGHIWEDEAETILNRLGYPTLLQWYGPQTKLILTGTPNVALAPGSTANFEDRLTLLETRVGNGPYEAGRGIIPLELRWQKRKSLGSEHRVSLRLADEAGRTWASRDSYPQGGQAFFTDLAIDQTLTDRHGLLVPPGTPPGLYRFLLSVRQVDDARPLDLLDEAGQPLGAELPLGQVEVIDPDPPIDPAALPVQYLTEATFDRRVKLIGYSLGEGPFKAGQAMPLNLFWQSLEATSEPLTVLIEFQDTAGQTVVTHQREPIRPTATWQPGMLLRDPQEVALPPTLSPGQYQVFLSLQTPEQRRLPVAGDERLLLTTVTTVDRPRVFEAPTPQIELSFSFGDQARLIGADLPQTQVKLGEWLPLTLYWQGLKTFDKSWTVFVHLIDSQGQIITQQDHVPGDGQFPTTSWLPDEYLTDTYNLHIPADVTPSDQGYQLRIGLYDANDFSRLPVVEGGKVVGDYIILEDWQISVQ